jgi:hypothetical protein
MTLLGRDGGVRDRFVRALLLAADDVAVAIDSTLRSLAHLAFLEHEVAAVETRLAALARGLVGTRHLPETTEHDPNDHRHRDSHAAR